MFRGLISSLLLPELFDGLRSLRSEQVRCEYVGLLGLLVRRFPRVAELADLVPLTDTSDPENDFFEIVRTLQVAKRTKAIRRLVRALETGPTSSHRQFSASTSNKALLPIVSYFVTDASFAKYPLLQQNCLEAVRHWRATCPGVRTRCCCSAHCSSS